MPDQTKYVDVDGTPHILAEGERTVCFIVVPPDGSFYTLDEVPSDLCPECAEKSGVEVPAKKSKAKASGGKT